MSLAAESFLFFINTLVIWFKFIKKSVDVLSFDFLWQVDLGLLLSVFFHNRREDVVNHMHIEFSFRLRSESIDEWSWWTMRSFFWYFFHDFHIGISYSFYFFSIFGYGLSISYLAIWMSFIVAETFDLHKFMRVKRRVLILMSWLRFWASRNKIFTDMLLILFYFFRPLKRIFFLVFHIFPFLCCQLMPISFPSFG